MAGLGRGADFGAGVGCWWCNILCVANVNKECQFAVDVGGLPLHEQ